MATTTEKSVRFDASFSRGFYDKTGEFGITMPKDNFMRCFFRDGKMLEDPDFQCVIYSFTGFFPSQYAKYQVRVNFFNNTISVYFEKLNGLYKICESPPAGEAILR